jgi:hypothetical protein
MWNATDEEERHALAEQALTDDAVLQYPTFGARGRDEVIASGERYRRETPGFRIVMTSGVEQHHGWVRVAWRMVLADGSTAAEGQSAGELAQDGRLRRVIGFRNPLPPFS